MGIKSTYYIERETAIRVMQSKLYQMTNEELSNALESLKESTYRNYSIVSKLEEKEENEDGDFDVESSERFNIRDVSEFEFK